MNFILQKLLLKKVSTNVIGFSNRFRFVSVDRFRDNSFLRNCR